MTGKESVRNIAFAMLRTWRSRKFAQRGASATEIGALRLIFYEPETESRPNNVSLGFWFCLAVICVFSP